MDVATCAGLAVLEAWAIARFEVLRGLNGTMKTTQAFWTLFIVQYLLVKYYRFFLYHKYFSPWRHLPTPGNNHFLFGQGLNLFRAPTPVSLLVQWMEAHPSAPFIRYLSWFNAEILLVNSPAAHREVLRTRCYSFQKPDQFRRMIQQMAGEKSLAMLEFDEHRAHRKMLAGIFTPAKMRKLAPVFEAKAREMHRLFDHAIAVGGDGGRTGVIDCTDTFSRVTLDAVGIAIFGIDFAHIKDGEDDGEEKKYSFHDAYNGIFGMDSTGKVLLLLNSFIPIRWIPIEANRRFLRAISYFDETLTALARSRRREITEAIAFGKYETQGSKDLLSYLVEESLPGGNAEGMPDKYIADHLLVFLGAGHDSSADMASWSVYIMATKPEIQEKLRAEVLELVSRNSNPDIDDIDALPYLNKFFKESMRVYCPATELHRQAEADMVIEGVPIPKGSELSLHPAVTAMNPLIWGEDAHTVDPERWDSSRLTSEQLAPWANNVFSNGPRICIGKQMAYIEMKIILFELIRTYRFLSVEGPFTVENPAVTLRPTGMKVRLEKLSY